jgi:hypothetical protein
LTSKKHEFEHNVKLDVEARVREGVKAVLEVVLQAETGGRGGVSWHPTHFSGVL